MSNTLHAKLAQLFRLADFFPLSMSHYQYGFACMYALTSHTHKPV